MKVIFLARPRLVFLTERKLQFILGAVLFFVCGCSGRATVGLDENGRLVATVDNTAPITGTTSTVIAGPSGQTPPPRVAQPTQYESRRSPWPRTITGERMAACYDEIVAAIEAGRWLDVNLLAIRFSRLCGRAADEGATTDERRGADDVKRNADAAFAEKDGRR